MGEFFGFELSGRDGLFLLGDFTVTHNTFIFSRVIQRVEALGWKSGVLVHRRELRRQASSSLTRHGIEHGFVDPDNSPGAWSAHVASVDTAVRRLGPLQPWLEALRLAVIDEAHHIPAPKWSRTLAIATNAARLGVTATPYRADGKGLGDWFDVVVRGPSVAELTRDGYLSPAIIFAPPEKADVSKVKRRGADFIQSDLAGVLDQEELILPVVRHYARLCPGVPAIAFCASVAHAEHVAAAFSAAGWAAASIDGSMSDRERDQRIAGLGNGRLHVLASCDVISEGTDIPAVGAALLMRSTLSTQLYQQQIGRALRTSPGRDRSIIIDTVRNSMLHGLPDADRPWTLKGGTVGLERAVPKPVRCPSCWRVHAVAPQCPTCGRMYRAKVAAAALPNLDVTLHGFSSEQIRNLGVRDAAKLGRNLEELRTIGEIRGHKPGWAWMVWNDRGRTFGHGSKTAAWGARR